MSDVAAITQALPDHAEEICQRYLSNGKRVGRYWQVGDLANNPGRSLVVHLEPPRRGRWQDYATQERGDLLDLIRHAGRYPDVTSAIDAARQFLTPRHSAIPPKASDEATYDPVSAARRLFQQGRPIKGTLAEAYLHCRRITAAMDCSALRFHPALTYCNGAADRQRRYPALLAAVTDHDNRMTGVQRTYLDPGRSTKAAVASPRKALGKLSGHGQIERIALPGQGSRIVLVKGKQRVPGDQRQCGNKCQPRQRASRSMRPADDRTASLGDDPGQRIGNKRDQDLVGSHTIGIGRQVNGQPNG